MKTATMRFFSLVFILYAGQVKSAGLELLKSCAEKQVMHSQSDFLNISFEEDFFELLHNTEPWKETKYQRFRMNL